MMGKRKLLSVVVPVFKVEAYLDRCISSIVSQSYRNLEIILVDDGSPDNSPAICDAWAERDRRVRVIHQKNAGSAAARNRALDLVQGQYVAFVDSDDYIATDMFEYLIGLLEDGADIAECAFQTVHDDSYRFQDSEDVVRHYSASEAMALHLRDAAFRQLIWNKIYRREVIADVRFAPGKRIDDEFFTYRLLGNANRLVKSTRVLYAYRQQDASVMHSLSSMMMAQAVEAKTERHRYILERFPDLREESLKNLWFTALYQGQQLLRIEGNDTQKAAFEQIRQYLRDFPMNHETLRCCSTKEKLWLEMARCSFLITCRIRNKMRIGV